jgi:hypothetical protein
VVGILSEGGTVFNTDAGEGVVWQLIRRSRNGIDKAAITLRIASAS